MRSWTPTLDPRSPARTSRPPATLRCYAALAALALGLGGACGDGAAGNTGGSEHGTGSPDESSGTGSAGDSTAGLAPTSSGEATNGHTTETGGEAGEWVPPPPVDVPPLPEPPDASSYPLDEMGRPIVSQGPLINWVIATVPDAISGRERCADLVANCHAPGVRSIDACMLSAPACATAEPWLEATPCCAEACLTGYAALRMQGMDPIGAYLQVLFEAPICMPGVDAMLGGAP